MAIAPWSTCDYEASVEEIRRSETVWTGRERLSNGKRLAGRTPRICVDQWRIAITAESRKDAAFRQIVVPAGDAIFRVVKPGDSLYLSHTSCATFGVSLVRDGQLVLAFGSVTSVPLGTTVKVSRGPQLSSRRIEVLDDTWIEVSSGGHTSEVRTGQVLTVGAYDVYVERTWNLGLPGDDEQASLAITTIEGLPVAAMRSAILLANAGRHPEWKSWDDD